MLPSANASGEEQKPCGSCQGEAVEPLPKCPTPLHTICNLPATGMGGQGAMEGAEECLAALPALSSFTWRSFLVLAALISRSPAVAVGSPGKPDCKKYGMARDEGNANLVLQGTIFI